MVKDFNGQREGEKVLFVFRRHIIAMRKGFYLLAIPFAISAIPPLLFPNNLELFWIPVGGLAFGLIMFAYHFLMWRYTYYLVTDQRLRHVTQKGFFGTNVVELNLLKIQNISYNIPGMTGEILKYGTIIVQTYVGDLIIRNVEDPVKIYNKLQDAVAAAESNRRVDHNEAHEDF